MIEAEKSSKFIPSFIRDRNTLWSMCLIVVVTLVWVYTIISDTFSDEEPIFWIFGIIFGVTVQRSRFCFTSAFRDFFLLGQTKILKAILLSLAISSIGFVMVMSTIVPNPGFGSSPTDANVLPVGISTIIAGTLFGIGMVLAGGCVSGSLYRMGEGYLASWVTIIGVMLGLFLLNNSWNWWWDNLISFENKIWLPAKLSYSGALLVTSLILLFILTIAVWREKKFASGFTMPIIKRRQVTETPTNTLSEITYFTKNVFKKEWNPLAGGIILALINIFLFIRFHPLGVVGEISRWTMSITNVLGFSELDLRGLEGLGACVMSIADGSWLTAGFFLNIGIVCGSAASALLAKEFKIRAPKSPKRYIQSLIGGLIMGYGAGLGLGCTLGAFFSAVPSLALNGWVYAVGLTIGAYIGVQIIKRLT
jgi:uncharacterized membrane protein YedE/YeeE